MLLPMTQRSEFFLPSFGAHLSSVPAGLEYEQIFFPVPAYTPNGFDLEYTSLLLVDGLVMDQKAYEFISDASRPEFSEMFATVRKLEDGGYLTRQDFGRYGERLRKPVQQLVNKCLEHPEAWLQAAREQFAIFAPMGKMNVDRICRRVDVARESIHFGVHCFLKSTSDKFDLKEALRLESALRCRRKRYNEREWEEIKGIIRPMIEQAVFNRELSRVLDIPFLDWDDMAPFHSNLSLQPIPSKTSVDTEKAHLDACRHLFTVALPSLKPNSVDQVIRFMKRKSAVRSLRREIQRAIYEGSTFDQKWVDEIRDHAMLAQIAQQKRQQRFHWISSGLSLIPALGGILHHIPTAIEVGMTVLEKGADLSVEGQMERRGLSKYEWYYTMLEIERAGRVDAADRIPSPAQAGNHLKQSDRT
jgi:hypothetical protein